MFENSIPPAFPQNATNALQPVSRDVASGGVSVREVDAADRGETLCLRAIEWSDLTARLNAARDLRELLRKDVEARLNSATGAAGNAGEIDFARAAAQFFRANEEDQRAVNQKGLDACKPSSATYPIVTDAPNTQVPYAEPVPTAHCEPGDARDKR